MRFIDQLRFWLKVRATKRAWTRYDRRMDRLASSQLSPEQYDALRELSRVMLERDLFRAGA